MSHVIVRRIFTLLVAGSLISGMGSAESKEKNSVSSVLRFTISPDAQRRVFSVACLQTAMSYGGCVFSFCVSSALACFLSFPVDLALIFNTLMHGNTFENRPARIFRSRRA